MKTLIPLFLVFILASCQKEEINPMLTNTFCITSTSTGATYPIKVALPQHYDPTTQTYATIYVLDCDENFNFVAENAEKISTEKSTSNVVVVGIGYGHDRAVDYTPSDANEGDGGAEQFMLFIQHELIPRIESEYGVDTSREGRVILGHSFGGLLGAYAFTNHNAVFGNYLMLSPSIWYDNEIILKLEKANRNTIQENHQLVYLGLGELEKSGRMLAPFYAFSLQLEKNYPGIALQKQLQPHLDHQGSKNPNIIDGLHFYFQNR